ncbi:MAG: hypothetical protein LBP79_01545 [Clostridiales bacterium]|jgi:hypothetical protein|nr:hypothetical protein [Clostridiales bacterium]
MEAKKPRSEAQKAADKRYYQKVAALKKYDVFCTTFSSVELQEIDETLEKFKIGKIEFIRRGIKALKDGKL